MAALAGDDPIRKWLAAEKPWPTGKVSVQEGKAPARASAAAVPRLPRPMDLELVGPSGSLFKGVTVSYDLPQQHLVAEDGLGEKLLSHSAQ